MGQSSVPDFSTQWSQFTDHRGYFVSEELLDDVMKPFVRVQDLRDKSVGEVGCGNGRFIRLLAPVAARVVAIEPSDGFFNTEAMVREQGFDNVELIHESVYDLPSFEPLDMLMSIGVIHHLPDPLAALRAMHARLKDGGRCLIWVYGKEGNELYLSIAEPMRLLTQRMPHRLLKGLSTGLTAPLWSYIQASKRLPMLPMADYMSKVLGRFDLETLRLTIYDQLNPTIANYWTEAEVGDLMREAGFRDVELHHRHGYSWTATGLK